MQVIKVKEVSVGDLTPANINVARSDLILEDDLINEAKNEVSLREKRQSVSQSISQALSQFS